MLPLPLCVPNQSNNPKLAPADPQNAGATFLIARDFGAGPKLGINVRIAGASECRYRPPKAVVH
jgi:hypothetical protein